MKPKSPVVEGYEALEVLLAKDQSQYEPLPVLILGGEDRRMASRWTLTDQERLKVARGEDIYIQQLTFGNPFQPISVGLESEVVQLVDEPK